MSLTHLDFAAPTLTPDEFPDAFRMLEAGLYAEHLLGQAEATAWDPRELAAAAAAGRQAWEGLWASNVRLVVKLSHEAARNSSVPLEEIFQEGCLALAEALQRFDFRRGFRFATFAHEYIRRATRDASWRGGLIGNTTQQRRTRAELRAAAETLHVEQRSAVGWRTAARRAGLSLDQAAASTLIYQPLDDAPQSALGVDGGYEAVDFEGTDFLSLLGPDGDLLRMRFGIGCPALTQTEVAQRIGTSASAVARLELRALSRARRLMDGDECRDPVLSRPQRGRAVACAPSPTR